MINLEQRSYSYGTCGTSSIDRSHRGFQVTNPGWAVDPCRRGTEDSVVSRNCWLGGRKSTKKSRYLGHLMISLFWGAKSCISIDIFWDRGLCECVCFWYLSMLCETCVYICIQILYILHTVYFHIAYVHCASLFIFTYPNAFRHSCGNTCAIYTRMYVLDISQLIKYVLSIRYHPLHLPFMSAKCS